MNPRHAAALALSLILSVAMADGSGRASAETASPEAAHAPKLTVKPTSLNFGKVPVDSKATKQVTLVNASSAAITISGITTTNSEFTASQNCIEQLAPGGGSCPVSVTFSPLSASKPKGTKVSASLMIADSAKNSPSKVKLEATSFGTPVPTATPTPTATATATATATPTATATATPTINSITIEPQPVVTTATLSASASDPSGSTLTYTWTVGGVQVASGANATWNSPGIPGNYLVELTVANAQGAIATATASMMVSSQSPWPRFRRSIQGTGLSPVDTSADTGALKWTGTFTDFGAFLSSPAVGADGTIYVGQSTYGKESFDNVYALNPDGTQKWEFHTGSPGEGLSAFSSPAVGADGTIYVGSDDGNFYALNPNGTQKWEFATAAGVESSPAVGADGTIYVGSDDGNVYALNPNGTLKWKFATGSEESSPAVGTDGTIYVGSYALNPDGTLKWASPTRVSDSPAVGADGTIYVGSEDFNVYALNPDGTLKWTFATGGLVESSPAVGADGTIYVGSLDDNVYALNPDGTLKWKFATAGGPSLPAVGSPAVGADGTIYVGGGFNVYALNPNGTEKWTFATLGSVESSPAVGADGTIYIGDSQGNVYALH